MRTSFTLKEPLISVTDNEVEIKFLCQVVETFNLPLKSNIDIFHKRSLLWLHRVKRHWTFQCPKSFIC